MAPVAAAVGDNIKLGLVNSADAQTKVKGSVDGAAPLRVVNTNNDGPALSLSVGSGSRPMVIDSGAKVKKLNADRLDGRSAGYFAKALKAGDTIEGTFQGSGGDLIWIGDAVNFPQEIPYPIPQSSVHYLTTTDAPTSDCPGVGQAAAGHLCLYEGWSFAATFSHTVTPLDGTISELPTHGFGIYWVSSDVQANVVGSWAYTVPSSPLPDLAVEPIELPGSMPAR